MAALPELLPHEGQRILERIIVPLDGSARAEQVLNLVVPFARLLGSELTLLHVLLARHETPGRRGEISYPDTLHDRARSLATDYLAEVSRNIVQDRTRTKTVVAAGRVSDMILAHAEHGSFSMIAVGAKPRARFRRMFREGITETVWAKSKVPVLFWIPNADEDGIFDEGDLPECLVVPVDGSSRSELALEYARQLANAADLGVTVLGVKPAKMILQTVPGTEVPYASDPDAYLAEKIENLRAAGATVDLIRSGRKTIDALNEVDPELPPHMVVMPAGRRRKFSRSLFGYPVAHIARRTSNPTIFLPPEYEPPPEDVTYR